MHQARTTCPYCGVGSGDVELLTLKAARLLACADAVDYDRLVGDDVLALIPHGRERYNVGKARGHHSVQQALTGTLVDMPARLAAHPLPDRGRKRGEHDRDQPCSSRRETHQTLEKASQCEGAATD